MHRGAGAWPGFVAASLLLGSSVLQLAAAAQRWLLADTTALVSPVMLEDHLYDYTFPEEPWESIGSAALLFGLGYLLLAAAMGILPFAVVPRSSWLTAVILAPMMAVPTALSGIHAAVSGVQGTPSDLADVVAGGGFFDVAAVVGLAVLTWLANRRSAVLGAGVGFLFGTTGLAYFLATFFIVPAVGGYISHDTTPWSEAFGAVCVGMAALAIFGGSKPPAARPIIAPTGPRADIADAS